MKLSRARRAISEDGFDVAPGGKIRLVTVLAAPAILNRERLQNECVVTVVSVAKLAAT